MIVHQKDDVALVQASFARVVPHADELTRGFYGALFSGRPDLRPMFPADMDPQRGKLAAALAFAVNSLRKPEVLAPALIEMGRRHVAYGTRHEHFSPVGEALLSALAATDPGWDGDTREAWTVAYTAVVGLMSQGMSAAAA